MAVDPFSLQGRVALVTGGARGIGAAITDVFLDAGASVMVADIAEIQSSDDHPSRETCVLDVRDPNDWQRAIRAVGDRFGRLDILVNNAGVFSVAPIADETVEAYMRMVQVNQLGVFLGMQAALPALKKAGGGSIINMSSAAGLVGTPRTIGYSATKWAVRGMTKVAALEFAPFGIRVNSVHPAAVATDMVSSVGMSANAGSGTPMGRIAEAAEIARVALFLASDASGFSTGSEFVCDGGLTAG